MISLSRSLQYAKASLRLIVAAAVLLASTSLAVGSGAACSKKGKTFPDLMTTVPASTSHFAYWAIEDLNADEDLWDVYARFKESADTRQLEEFVPVLATVSQSARAISYSATGLMNPVTVYKGDFDFKYIQAQLAAIGYSHDGVVWTLEDNQTTTRSVGLRSPVVLVGEAPDLTACLDVIVKSSSQSLQGDPNIRLVADKLPDGILVEINRDDASHGEHYPGLVTYGKSYSKAGENTLKLTAVYLFGDGPAASTAQEQIRDYLAAVFDDIKVKRDQNYVIATSQVSISDFAETLSF